MIADEIIAVFISAVSNFGFCLFMARKMQQRFVENV